MSLYSPRLAFEGFWLEVDLALAEVTTIKAGSDVIQSIWDCSLGTWINRRPLRESPIFWRWGLRGFLLHYGMIRSELR